jgi:hypothetical protein
MTKVVLTTQISLLECAVDISPRKKLIDTHHAHRTQIDRSIAQWLWDVLFLPRATI